VKYFALTNLWKYPFLWKTVPDQLWKASPISHGLF